MPHEAKSIRYIESNSTIDNIIESRLIASEAEALWRTCADGQERKLWRLEQTYIDLVRKEVGFINLRLGEDSDKRIRCALYIDNGDGKIVPMGLSNLLGSVLSPRSQAPIESDRLAG
jgi:hypothetical protein